MNQMEIDQRIAELREQYPAMFSHPELKEGEIVVYSGPAEATMVTEGIYHKKGMRSVRMSKGHTMGKLKCIISGKPEEIDMAFYYLFMSQREFVLAERANADKQDEPARAKV